MIIVTGTKRSGTSLWMQLLIAAGFTPFGEAFPARWSETLRDANPEGFFESSFRNGIYYATNPNPQTGVYVFPEQVDRHVVKVFVPGLVRTDRAFIGKVVATMRSFREYEASIHRLNALEDATRKSDAPPRPDPVLEWWMENYMLVRDISIRRYAAHVESYGRLMRDPESVVGEVVAWLGGGDAAAAIERVKPEHRHFDAPDSSAIEPEYAALFDELYDTVDRRAALSKTFVEKLNEANRALFPRIQADLERVRKSAPKNKT